ncbi:MAG: HNH endonuclease [Brasilonema angustatum HA4187-MV1]|jgi:hypothetical protein|nr:HNH endonuclease [Brasilonema angustatum HA4187-MV1]
MPISAKNKKLYPKDWKQIAVAIKDKANWTCEECNRPCRRPSETWDDFKYRLARKSKKLYLECCEKPVRFVATVSHSDHTPLNCHPSNLRCLCAPCHLRYDAHHHAKNAAKTRKLKQKVKPKKSSKPQRKSSSSPK